ncbi:FAD-linked oxidase C-terminal domain-containing protein [Actinophytocola sp.]|uniref:FAD-binding oxidoreductase n=1 Tax=Actinophytocola sp. TaxID=1872138 RepID=UPI0025C473E6|nr:FAD-linked oxidase C-terminal domain-containing protein [Actinophytocola sp.]
MNSVLIGFGALVVVIAVGWVAGRARVLGDGAAGVLPRLSYFVATPALLLLTLADADPGVLLRARYEALRDHPLFAGIEYTVDRSVLADRLPLVFADRPATEPVAVTRSHRGTDVDFGVLTRRLLAAMAKQGAVVRLGQEVRSLRRVGDRWHVDVRDGAPLRARRADRRHPGLRRADRRGAARGRAGIRIVTYGHVGDGNLHYNLSKPVGGDDAAFLARADELSRIAHDATAGFAGSISAEHGIGQSKRDTIAGYKSAVELDLMRDVKHLLDPAGLLNPGKVLPGRDET